MDTVPGLKDLQERKRELLLESDLNRQLLRVECSRIGYRLAQYQRGYNWAHSAWLWAAPFAGFLLARRFGKATGLFARGSVLLGVVRKLWEMWSARRERGASRGEPPSSPDSI